MKFKVTHYDETLSFHETFDGAFEEAARRLEPWREGRDTIQRQNWEPSAEAGIYVFVATPILEPTDAESYIEVSE